MLAHGFFVIAQQVGDVGDRYASLQQDSRESMAEAMRRGGLLKLAGEFKNLVNLFSPQGGHGFEPVGSTHDKRARSAPFGPCLEPVPEPVRNVGEDLTPVFLRAQEYFIAL